MVSFVKTHQVAFSHAFPFLLEILDYVFWSRHVAEPRDRKGEWKSLKKIKFQARNMNMRWKSTRQAPAEMEIFLSCFPGCFMLLVATALGLLISGRLRIAGEDFDFCPQVPSQVVWWCFPAAGDSENFSKNEDLYGFSFSINFWFHAVFFAGLEGPLGVTLRVKDVPEETRGCFTRFGVFCVLFAPRACKLIPDQRLEVPKTYLM